jgi:hypothetical protein
LQSAREEQIREDQATAEATPAAAVEETAAVVAAAVEALTTSIASTTSTSTSSTSPSPSPAEPSADGTISDHAEKSENGASSSTDVVKAKERDGIHGVEDGGGSVEGDPNEAARSKQEEPGEANGSATGESGAEFNGSSGESSVHVSTPETPINPPAPPREMPQNLEGVLRNMELEVCHKVLIASPSFHPSQIKLHIMKFRIISGICISILFSQARSVSPDSVKAAELYRKRVCVKFDTLQRDAYLLVSMCVCVCVCVCIYTYTHTHTYSQVKALCKLSMKALPEDARPEPLALRSKTLSLELLLSVLENSGPVFRSSLQFISLVKDDLVNNSLLRNYEAIFKNYAPDIEYVFRLSSSIFIALITHFKTCLRTEIAVFLDTIYLRILSSPNSTCEDKLMSLKVIASLCQEPKTIVECFLNYDCDLNNLGVFQNIVTHLEKIAQVPRTIPTIILSLHIFVRQVFYFYSYSGIIHYVYHMYSTRAGSPRRSTSPPSKKPHDYNTTLTRL